MSPLLASKLGGKLHPYRRLFLALSLGSLAVLTAVFLLSHRGVISNLAFAAMGPLVIVPWGLLCLGASFGPASGFNVRNGNVSMARRILSWYAALLFSVFVIGGFIWPFLVIFE
jgi:hypothetical protein